MIFNLEKKYSYGLLFFFLSLVSLFNILIHWGKVAVYQSKNGEVILLSRLSLL